MLHLTSTPRLLLDPPALVRCRAYLDLIKPIVEDLVPEGRHMVVWQDIGESPERRSSHVVHRRDHHGLHASAADLHADIAALRVGVEGDQLGVRDGEDVLPEGWRYRSATPCLRDSQQCPESNPPAYNKFQPACVSYQAAVAIAHADG